MATINDVFEIGEVGLYLDVAAAGSFPTWELPSFKDDYNFQAVVTPWVKYTAVFTGLGSVVTQDIWSMREGDTLHVRGSFTCGTPTATEARMSLGFNGTNGNVTSDATKVASLQPAGVVLINTADARSYYALMESGVGYLTFGGQGPSTGGLSKGLGNVLFGTWNLGIKASVPISGW
jgi:hypothetical protein